MYISQADRKDCRYILKYIKAHNKDGRTAIRLDEICKFMDIKIWKGAKYCNMLKKAGYLEIKKGYPDKIVTDKGKEWLRKNV